MDGRMDGWMDGKMDGWMNELFTEQENLYNIRMKDHFHRQKQRESLLYIAMRWEQAGLVSMPMLLRTNYVLLVNQ